MSTDLKCQIAAYTAVHGEFSVVDVPPLDYLMVDGHGDPNTSAAYRDAIASIYPLAYGLKFLSKRELGRDHVVMPLEALCWSADMAAFTTGRDKSSWNWTVMVMVPEWITRDHLETVRGAAGRKAGPMTADVRLERLVEGWCVQTLHIGSYDDEAPVLAAMHDEFIPGHALRMTGRHHEVYLSDARRTSPDRLRRVLRQPVADASDEPSRGGRTVGAKITP